jgi:YD repeat-containing protein
VTGFAYDAGGQLLERTDPLGRTTAWAYDQLGAPSPSPTR